MGQHRPEQGKEQIKECLDLTDVFESAVPDEIHVSVLKEQSS